jgi:alkylation response protein AidB-like acyl-CoA dehydrogenase
MVNFQLDEMQEMLRELAHEFAVDEIRPNAEHWDLNSEYPKDVINAAHEMGLLNYIFLKTMADLVWVLWKKFW